MSGASTGFVSVAPKLGSKPAYDGYRGGAVAAVVVTHAAYELMPSMAALVDVFFVLSGFLITTLLLEEQRKTGSIDLKRFYKRRAKRLLPLLYSVLAVTFVSIWLLGVIHGSETSASLPESTTYGGLFDMAVSDVLAGGLYVYHVVHPVGIELLTGQMPAPRPLVPLWSLGVEEHFYLLGTPFLIMMIRRRWLRPAAAVLLAAFVFIGTARALGHVGPRLAWYQRPDALMLGIAMAFLNAHITDDVIRRWERPIRWFTAGGAMVWVFTLFIGTKAGKLIGIYVPFHPMGEDRLPDGLYWPRFGFTVSAIAAAFTIFGLSRLDRTWLGDKLSGPRLTALGRRSYGIYIIHFPLAIILANAFPSIPAVAALLYFPILICTVELAHRKLEMPLMGNRVPAPRAGGGRLIRRRQLQVEQPPVE